MFPMVVLILVGFSVNLVRTENHYHQHRQQQQQQQRQQQQQQQEQQRQEHQYQYLPKNTTADIDYSSYYYECVLYININ